MGKMAWNKGFWVRCVFCLKNIEKSFKKVLTRGLGCDRILFVALRGAIAKSLVAQGFREKINKK